MGKLQVGDEVYDEHGRVCRVVEAFEPYVTDEAVEVRFGDGSTLVTDRPHKWTAYSRREGMALGQYRRRHGQPHRAWPDDWGTQWETASRRYSHNESTDPRTAKVRTTGEMMDAGGRFYIPVLDAPLEAPEAELPIDPYILGYWLGDGARWPLSPGATWSTSVNGSLRPGAPSSRKPATLSQTTGPSRFRWATGHASNSPRPMRTPRQ